MKITTTSNEVVSINYKISIRNKSNNNDNYTDCFFNKINWNSLVSTTQEYYTRVLVK